MCKVHCSTPYPKRLRQLISEMIKQGKISSPGSFIRIKVDIDNLLLSAHARQGDNWTHLKLDTVIPLDILYRNQAVSEGQLSDFADSIEVIPVS